MFTVNWSTFHQTDQLNANIDNDDNHILIIEVVYICRCECGYHLNGCGQKHSHVVTIRTVATKIKESCRTVCHSFMSIEARVIWIAVLWLCIREQKP